MTDIFVNRFKSNRRINVESWETQFQCLDSKEVSLLEAPFSEEKIRGELMRAGGNKSLNQDEFTFKFAQNFWPEFKEKLVALFN